MRATCRTCGAPVRYFALADDDDNDDELEVVTVEPLPRMGPIRRVDVTTDLAVDEGTPFPGGWPLHVHSEGTP